MNDNLRDWLLWFGKVLLELFAALALFFLLSKLSGWWALWLVGAYFLLVLWFMLATAGQKRPTLRSALRAVVTRSKKVPNPSIEPTAAGVPASAPHVKRCASPEAPTPSELGMTESPVKIRKLCPELMQDFLLFFDGEAFADNPKWGFCFCQFLYVDHAKVNWATRTVQENRAAACDRICNNRMEGYLAYRAGKPIGWCNAAPRTMMDSFADEPDPDAARIGQITCFVIAKPHRRSGVATSLLHAACAGLKAQGLQIAEAMPMAEASSDAQNHFGPLSMYLAAGFQVHRTDTEGRVYVRLSLV